MLASVANQAGLSLTWLETPEDTFSHDEAHIFSSDVYILIINQYQPTIKTSSLRFQD